MKWTERNTGAEIQAKNESSEGNKPGTAKYSIVVEVKPSHNRESFVCQTYFDKPPSAGHFAQNIPINNNAFVEIYTSAKLNVISKYCEPILFTLSNI